MSQTPPESAPRYDPALPHLQRPRLRPIRGFSAQVQGQQVIGLSDARQISEHIVYAPQGIQGLLPLLNGERTIPEIATEFGQGLGEEQLQGFVAHLDQAGLLFGPTFDRILSAMREAFDASINLPPAATAALTDMLVTQQVGESATQEQKTSEAPGALRKAMDEWIAKVLDGEEQQKFDQLPRAIIVPHIDYPRGWMNYAAVWGRLRGGERPDRVVILGTNHFGMSTGVTGCDKGYQTAFGVCQLDTRFVEALKSHLGSGNASKLFQNRFDHEHEHSIELQVPWIQHCLGTGPDGSYVKVFGALVHDPTVKGGESYDGEGLGLGPFVDAMRAALQDVGGRTLLVSSADLSHVGPMFGDQQTLAGEGGDAQKARERVLTHDRDMLQLVGSNRPDELVTAMAWQQNPTRWCSTGNIVAALKLAEPKEVRVLRYMAAMDPQGLGMVSSVGAVMH